MNIVVEMRGRVVPGEQGKALVRETAAAVQAKRASSLMVARAERIDRVAPERRSVARAMLAVEERLVKAFWVLQRSVSAEGPRSAGRCGLDYINDASDLKGYTDAAGGRWDSVAPRPPLPLSRDIDAATEAQGWLQWLGPIEARVLVLGAMSKRGDAGRRIDWMRVRTRLPECDNRSTRWLRMIYRNALRTIVTELTQARSNALD